ncbi:MAG: hypothetical protein JST68_12350 [Bacteroidetes bacterium]|nr:hypothetical protein [Bacteroidota bacterium]
MKFSRRNKSYSIHYDGEPGKNGRSSFDLFNFLNFRGSEGHPGGPGPHLQVNVSAIPSGDSILLALAVTEEENLETDYFYVNPRRGTISIFADGGHGGSGGDGSDVDYTSGYSGGNGGPGGAITMTYDSSAIPFVDCPCIIALNHGGRGGDGGEGGRKGDSRASQGSLGINGIPGPPVCKKDKNGNILRTMPPLKY